MEDAPGFEVGDGTFDLVADRVDVVELLLPVEELTAGWFAGCAARRGSFAALVDGEAMLLVVHCSSSRVNGGGVRRAIRLWWLVGGW